MIFYRIQKILPIFKNKYLSTKVNEAKPDPLKTQISLKGSIMILTEFLGTYMLWLLGPLMFVVFLLIIFLFSLFNINPNVDGGSLTKDFIKSTLTIPLSFVSIIIPIITLSLSYLKDKLDDSFRSIYLGNINPVSVFVVDLIYLSIILLLFLSSFWNDLSPEQLKIILSIALISNLVPIVATALLITKSITLVFDKIPYEPILKQMKIEIKEMIDFEITTRLFNRILKQKCKELNLNFNPYFNNYGYENVISSKDGYLIDINFDKMESFAKAIKSPKEGIISAHPFSKISQGSEIGYINFKDESIGDELNSALILNKKDKGVGKDLNKFKDLTLLSIKNDNETEFGEIIEVYVSGLEYYMKYMAEIGVKFESTELMEPFSQWRLLSLIWYDLGDVIKNAAQSNNSRLIAILSFNFMDIFNLAIKFEDFSIFKMIDFYSSIYYWSAKSNNSVGIDRSVRYLDRIMKNIEKHLENPDITVQMYDNEVNFFYSSLKTLISIFKESIDNNDFETFKEIDNKLSDQFNYFEPDFTGLLNRKRELKLDLDNLDGLEDEKKSLEREISLIDDIYNQKIKKEVHIEILIQKFEAASYIIKQIRKGIFKKSYEKYIDLLLSEFNSYSKIVSVLEYIHKREQLEVKFHLNGSIWELDEYTDREAILIDTMGRILFLFCLKGSQLVGVSADFEKLRSSKIVQSYLVRINSICETLKEEDWEWFMDNEMNSKIDEFQGQCKKEEEDN